MASELSHCVDVALVTLGLVMVLQRVQCCDLAPY